MSGTGKNGVNGAKRQSRALCVLLHAPGAAIPTELLASVSKKLPNITTFADSYTAFAEICAAAKTADGAALVLVEPARLADAAELIDAMRVQAPATPIWWFTQRDGRKLARLAPGEMSPWVVAAAPTPATAPTAQATAAKGPRLASTEGPETPRLKPGGAAAFRPAAKGAKPANDSPRVVVRPGGGIGAKRLRLVGEGEIIRPPVPATATKPLVVPETKSDGRGGIGGGSPAFGADEDERPRIPLLTEEELRMLLADDEPSTSNGPGQERSGR